MKLDAFEAVVEALDSRRSRPDMTTEKDIDWLKTAFEGSRREQLKLWCAMSFRERLEALDQLTARAERIHSIAAKTNSTYAQEARADYLNRGDKHE